MRSRRPPTGSTTPAQRCRSSGLPAPRRSPRGDDLRGPELAQQVRLVRLPVSRAPRGRAAPGCRPRVEPTPPLAPSTRTGPSPGVSPAILEMGDRQRGGVPAVPSAIACGRSGPRAAARPSRPASAPLRVAAVMRDADVVAVAITSPGPAPPPRPRRPRPPRRRRGRAARYGPPGPSARRPARPCSSRSTSDADRHVALGQLPGRGSRSPRRRRPRAPATSARKESGMVPMAPTLPSSPPCTPSPTRRRRASLRGAVCGRPAHRSPARRHRAPLRGAVHDPARNVSRPWEDSTMTRRGILLPERLWGILAMSRCRP